MGIDPEKAKKCMCFTKVFNYLTAYLFNNFSAVLIGFGIGGIIFVSSNDLAGGKIFLLFSPIFMMYLYTHTSMFGAIMIAAECKIKFMINYFTFLKSLLGRGIFTI